MELDDFEQILVTWDSLLSTIRNLEVTQPARMSERMGDLRTATDSMEAELKRQMVQRLKVKPNV